jgi:hypothetical protein
LVLEILVNRSNLHNVAVHLHLWSPSDHQEIEAEYSFQNFQVEAVGIGVLATRTRELVTIEYFPNFQVEADVGIGVLAIRTRELVTMLMQDLRMAQDLQPEVVELAIHILQLIVIERLCTLLGVEFNYVLPLTLTSGEPIDILTPSRW